MSTNTGTSGECIQHTCNTPLILTVSHHSLDELAHIDLPAMIDYALNMTNQTQLYYIAHSQGTTIAFANMATSQGLASKIKKIYALAPINSLKHVRGVFWLMSEYKNQVLVS